MADTQYPSDAQMNGNGGTPDPAVFRQHRKVPIPFREGDDLPGVGNTVTTVLPIAGALLVRGRLKFTCAGTLSFRYRRPPPSAGTAYSASIVAAHADLPVLADTETSFDIEPGGEGLLAVTFAASGAAGEVTFFDIMQQ